MKKLFLVFVSLLLILALVACVKNDNDDSAFADVNDRITAIEESLAKQKAEFEDSLNNLELEISDLEKTISELEEALEQEKQHYDEELSKLEQKLLSVLDILYLSEFSTFSFTQNEDTLEGMIQYEILIPSDSLLTPQDVTFTLKHPLTEEISEHDPIVFSHTDNVLTGELPISVQYHGYFELNIEFSYLDYLGDVNSMTFKLPVMFKVDKVNLAWLHATMPILLFASDLYSDYFDGYTYVEIERAKTYDFSKLPEKALKYPVSVSAAQGNYDQTQIPNFFENVTYGLSNYMIYWMEELYGINPDTTFKVIGVDNYLNVIASSMISKIPMDQMSFTVYTDGAFTGSMINKVFSDLDSFNDVDKEFTKWLANNTFKTKIDANMKSEYVLVASKLNNFEYVVNSTNGWNLDEELMNVVNDELNVRVLSVSDAFNRLEDINKLDELEYLLKTRWGEEENESMMAYFSKEPIKNLLILGTSPAGEIHDNYATFEQYLEKIVELYSSEYKIFYKGHPRYPSEDDRIELFDSYGVVELPNSIPVETLMLLYENVFIGGYNGTSFHSSQKGQTLFLFGTLEQIKSNKTMEDLIDNTDIFNETIYITVDSNGDVVIE